jgi:phage shock protein E
VRRTRPVAIAWATLMVLALAGCSGESAAPTATIETISPLAAADLIEEAPAGLVVLDVRTPEEFATGHLAGAVNLDYQAAGFPDELGALDREVPYLLYCRSGNRSAQVREMMRGLGFTDVYEIDGGILAWTQAHLALVAP